MHAIGARWLALVVTCLCATVEVRAQAAAEYGSLASSAASAGARAKAPSPKMMFPDAKPGAAAPKAPSRGSRSMEPLTVPTGLPTATLNCRALKERAGSEAARLNVRSLPEGSMVWVDELFVGTTPLDLELSPGAHRVELGGIGMKTHQQVIELGPRQVQELSVQLEPRYPTKIVLR